MPDDYSFAGGGLKLKGAGTGAGITKKKKKKKDKGTGTSEPSLLQKASREGDEGANTNANRDGEGVKKGEENETRKDGDEEAESGSRDKGEKTKEERRQEEMSMRRLHNRLQREGAKTHKERVEGLNRYLSTLSEHHDMPRIGPG